VFLPTTAKLINDVVKMAGSEQPRVAAEARIGDVRALRMFAWRAAYAASELAADWPNDRGAGAD